MMQQRKTLVYLSLWHYLLFVRAPTLNIFRPKNENKDFVVVSVIFGHIVSIPQPFMMMDYFPMTLARDNMIHSTRQRVVSLKIARVHSLHFVYCHPMVDNIKEGHNTPHDRK
jgi:hypothetical protein